MYPIHSTEGLPQERLRVLLFGETILPYFFCFGVFKTVNVSDS